jgi:hypothetical protein
MMHTGWFSSLIASLTLQWQECCENPAVFCYRIGWRLVSRQKTGAAEQDTEEQCSNRSENSFTLSMMFKD